MLIRLLILLLTTAAAILINLCLGEVTVAPAEALSFLFQPGSQGIHEPGLYQVILNIRLPRLLTALVVGIGLAVSGYVLQSLSRNNLADPYLTGVSSGAGLFVAIAVITGMSFTLVPLVAFSGGLAASLIVAFMARSPSGLSVTKLLLAGVALSAVCGAFITLTLVSAKTAASSQGLFFWLAGSVAGRTWAEFYPAAAYVFAGMALALLMSKPLRLLAVGTKPAASLGLDVTRAQCILLFAAVLMCSASVSVSGLVGFVGLIAPYLSRRLFGSDERIHLIAAALLGGTLVLLSDLAARTLGGGQELPLGTLLALIGGPFFLYLVVQQKSEGL